MKNKSNILDKIDLKGKSVMRVGNKIIIKTIPKTDELAGIDKKKEYKLIKKKQSNLSKRLRDIIVKEIEEE